VGVGLDACLESIAAAGYDEVHYLVRSDGEAVRWRTARLGDIHPKRKPQP
jgi:hypothetical protein